MSATITVHILLLAKTLLDEDCELSTTFCFASCNLLTIGCIQKMAPIQLAISFLIAKLLIFLQGDCERAMLGSLATRSASISASRTSL